MAVFKCQSCGDQLDIDSLDNNKVYKCASCGTVQTVTLDGPGTALSPGTPMHRQMRMCLQNGQYSSVLSCADLITIDHPSDAEANVAYLLASFRCRTLEELASLYPDYVFSSSYRNAVRYADPQLLEELEYTVLKSVNNNPEVRLGSDYSRIVSIASPSLREKLGAYDSTDAAGEQQYPRDGKAGKNSPPISAEQVRKNYSHAKMFYDTCLNSRELARAYELFSSCGDYDNAPEMAAICAKRLKISKQNKIVITLLWLAAAVVLLDCFL